MQSRTTMGDKFPVLIAEDDINDVFFLKRALQRAGIESPVNVVNDGHELMEYVSGRGKFADRTAHPFPRLILLDLKMPRMGGFEVLDWLRRTGDFKRIFVIVLSSSAIQADINKAYDLGANAYLIKPPAFEQLVEVLKKTTAFWCDLAEEPNVE